MPQINIVEPDYDREMLAIVSAINTIEAALDGVRQLLEQMEEDTLAELTGEDANKVDVWSIQLPDWIRGAKPNLSLTETNLENAMTSLEVLEDEIRQLDGAFRRDMDEVYTFDIEDVREEYSGRYGDRDYLDPDDVAELDEFFKRR